MPVLLVGVLWVIWWLGCVDWHKAWPVLAQGAWAPVVLLVLTVSLVWSQIWPETRMVWDSIVLPNFWWQLGCVSLWAAVALLCGWLQGILDWKPVEVELEPAAEEDSHEHH
jgi:hypothetical protein